MFRPILNSGLLEQLKPKCRSVARSTSLIDNDNNNNTVSHTTELIHNDLQIKQLSPDQSSITVNANEKSTCIEKENVVLKQESENSDSGDGEGLSPDNTLSREKHMSQSKFFRQCVQLKSRYLIVHGAGLDSIEFNLIRILILTSEPEKKR